MLSGAIDEASVIVHAHYVCLTDSLCACFMIVSCDILIISQVYVLAACAWCAFPSSASPNISSAFPAVAPPLFDALALFKHVSSSALADCSAVDDVDSDAELLRVSAPSLKPVLGSMRGDVTSAIISARREVSHSSYFK